MFLTLIQVIILAIVQGVTELFPVSSLGHAVVIPALLGWGVDPRGPGLLPFLVILHLGTAVALLLFFWREWIDLALAVVGAGDPAKRQAMRRLIVLLIVGTIPAAAAGAVLNKPLKELFAVPLAAAGFLVVNGVVLFLADRRHRLRTSIAGADGKSIEALTMTDALLIGVSQCAALIPGISRSGATILTGLSRKLTADAAAHFSFLLAAPIIGGAAVLEIPKLLTAIHEGHANSQYLTYSVIGGVIAGVAAFLSVAFLTRYFRATEVKMMRPFALYCIIAGIAAVAWLVLQSQQ
jgi:undecaprenyl-diphosphatase